MAETIILIGSKIGRDSILSSLGKPEYSYFFLLQEFLPALHALGRVIEVASTAEVDRLFDDYSSKGHPVVFLSFSPPHQTPLGLRCPTVPLFAWEFDSLPNVAWEGEPRNDWRYVFERVAGAVVTSREAAQLVREVSPLPVLALPAPVWARFADSEPSELTLAARAFSFAGQVIDSPLLGLSADGLVRRPPVVEAEEAPAEEPTGEQVASPPPRSTRWALSCRLAEAWWNEIRGCYAKPVVVAEPNVAPPAPIQHVQVDGVVFTTVLNPADGRKNWVDLITAFCWAFRDVPDATLIVKMTHHDLEYYRIVLITLLSRLAPFACRVLVLHGFLEDPQYRELMAATTFYVNASSGEGLCLPLMEFLCAGRPAIAPRHTAMADYLNDDIALPVACAPEPTCWPHDPTGMLVTHRHRLDWQSLMEAYRQAYAMAKEEPERYRAMLSRARHEMEAFCSVEQVSGALGDFLGRIAGSESTTPGSVDSLRSLA
ncbi:glycosyltransferase [Pseudomonas paraeruginosa]|uniref:glycosyltransferase n=1 Tax=Pseudomonas aeruginosa group TaxID=136841 RepID=UPI00071C16DB|nr:MULTISPECIES: glycosyltransferase [Pseudomonas aeruginosa group]KSF81564.1 glycosyltransferase [Pseudomonas aeruginosa]KSP83505.1 glycosyltransferase [Pseudomonas aeruginosa]MBG7008882.1 glycosyltransferase [Pseudomonas aeruginosa]MBG7026813.1 glycosyltransferase [Pseudomonas aeruginosa]MBG7373501.1 glycosyltransferase [Pseudomonas aeruginosa]